MTLAGFLAGLFGRAAVRHEAGHGWEHGFRLGMQTRWTITGVGLFLLWGLAGGMDRQAGL